MSSGVATAGDAHPLFQRLGDRSMMCLAGALQQRVVGDVLDEGVLERERRRPALSVAPHQPRFDELVELVVEILGDAGPDRAQEAE